GPRPPRLRDAGRDAARARQGAVGRPEHARPDRPRPHGRPAPRDPDGRAVRGRASRDSRHHHGGDPQDEPGGGGHVPHRLPRDGRAAPALPARVGDGRRPSHRRGHARRGGAHARGARGVSRHIAGGVMARLDLEHVAAGYVEGIDILSDITLRVEPGSITGIIGPNGAGKSTLLRTIFGFLRARRGTIALDGRPIHTLAPHEVKRLGISYVPQGANIFPQLTVEENLLLGAWVIRRERARVAERLERAYAAFPRLLDRRRRRATALSGGEAKMLSLAKELVTDPALILVDEPSAGLAPRIVEQVYARLLEVRGQGVTILLVDQNINKAVEVSDYLYMIERGGVKREGPRAEFADQLRDIVRDSLLGA